MIRPCLLPNLITYIFPFFTDAASDFIFFAWTKVPLRLQLRRLSNQLEKYDNWLLSLSMITWTGAINARSTTLWIDHSSHTLSLRKNVLLEFYHTSALQRQLSVWNFTIWRNSAQTAVPYRFIILHGMTDVGRYILWPYCHRSVIKRRGKEERRRATEDWKYRTHN